VKAVFVVNREDDPENPEWDFWGFDWTPKQHESTLHYCELKELQIHVVEIKLPPMKPVRK
jgi:hypothetical protein